MSAAPPLPPALPRRTGLPLLVLLAGALAIGALALGVPRLPAPLAPAPQETADRPPHRAAPRAIVTAARAQIGVTTGYDPAYVPLAFPGGDVPRDRGVCIDVVVRALRDGAGIDLQRAVNRDMAARFAAYPRRWGLAAPDPSIDHRRVPNVAELLDHLGATMPPGTAPLPGDILTSAPQGRPHVVIVSDRSGRGGQPLAIHNIGRGTQEQDVLALLPATGHYRLTPAVLARLRALDR